MDEQFGDLAGNVEGVLLGHRTASGALAQVLAGGLHEFINHEDQKNDFDLITACTRALERASAITSADLRRGLAVLATVGATAPFVGLLGTVFGTRNSGLGKEKAQTVELVGLYWHFVDIVWVIIFTVIYLIPIG